VNLKVKANVNVDGLFNIFFPLCLCGIFFNNNQINGINSPPNTTTYRIKKIPIITNIDAINKPRTVRNLGVTTMISGIIFPNKFSINIKKGLTCISMNGNG